MTIYIYTHTQTQKTCNILNTQMNICNVYTYMYMYIYVNIHLQQYLELLNYTKNTEKGKQMKTEEQEIKNGRLKP